MICHKNKYFSVKLKNTYYEIVYPYNHSAIIPVFNDNSFLIVKAKRKILNKNLWEFPSGNPTSKKEKLKSCARRELFEETGIYIRDLSRFKSLGKLLPQPARSKNYVESFYVKITNKEYKSRKKYDKEIFQIKKLKYLSLIKLIKKNQFYVSTHVAAFFLLLIKNFESAIGKNHD